MTGDTNSLTPFAVAYVLVPELPKRLVRPPKVLGLSVLRNLLQINTVPCSSHSTSPTFPWSVWE